MDDIVTLFFAAILLMISCVVVYRWSVNGKIDDVSGIIGAVGVFVAIVFIFSTGGAEIAESTGMGLTKTLEIVMRPVAVAAAAWTGFMFGGTTGLTVALIITSPNLFPGVGIVKDLANAGTDTIERVSSIASGIGSVVTAPFRWLFGSSSQTEGKEKRGQTEGERIFGQSESHNRGGRRKRRLR